MIVCRLAWQLVHLSVHLSIHSIEDDEENMSLNRSEWFDEWQNNCSKLQLLLMENARENIHCKQKTPQKKEKGESLINFLFIIFFYKFSLVKQPSWKVASLQCIYENIAKNIAEYTKQKQVSSIQLQYTYCLVVFFEKKKILKTHTHTFTHFIANFHIPFQCFHRYIGNRFRSFIKRKLGRTNIQNS